MSNIQKSKLSPAHRMALFNQATRKYLQTLGGLTFKENNTVITQLPKTRFLSRIILNVKGKFTTKHATKTTFNFSNVFDKHNLLKSVRLSLQNGFHPYQINGNLLKIYNDINDFRILEADNFKTNICGNVVSVAGTENFVNFTIELPVTINSRDAIGLIMLQDDSTNVELQIDCNSIKSMIAQADHDIDIENLNITITPTLETFDIPRNPDFRPDYSMVKILNQMTQNVVSAGEMQIKMPVGMTYRKIILYLAKDTNFTPLEHEKINKIEVKFNQADTPISINMDLLAYENTKEYSGKLPLGCYVLDFSTQGIPNFGGGRDYIDTEKLTEFWINIHFDSSLTGNSNYVYIAYENLTQLF